MSDTDLRAKIEKAVSGMQLAVLATVTEDGKPWARYVMTNAKGLTFYVTTFLGSRKVNQIKANPDVHVTLGASTPEAELPYVQVVATAEILTDEDTKKAMWFDHLTRYFSGPDDPNYGVIKINPTRIEYMEPGKMAPQVFEL